MYFCKYCGSRYMSVHASVCIHCGAPKGIGNRFCPKCGSEVKSKFNPKCHLIKSFQQG